MCISMQYVGLHTPWSAFVLLLGDVSPSVAGKELKNMPADDTVPCSLWQDLLPTFNTRVGRKDYNMYMQLVVVLLELVTAQTIHVDREGSCDEGYM